MATKIDKLGLADPYDANIIYIDGNPEFPSYIKVNADVEVELKVLKSGANGTLRPKWIAKPIEKGPFTSKDLDSHTGDVMGAKVEAKFCGPQIYHVEAFLDEPINTTPNRILVQGYAPEKIVKAEWRKTKDGSSMGSTPNKFGDDVWLHLDTEGLNGAKLKISVYNDGYGDELVGSYIGKCYGGEMNINFKDTFSWRASTGWWTSNSEEFYVKVQVNGKSYYINDSSGKKEIAKYVVFKDEITKRTTEKSTNNLPVTVDENEIDLERYEPCRFKKITVTDEGNDIPLFEEGKLKIDQDNKKEFAVSEKIYFQFDKSNLTAGAQEVLDGIATFLLDSPFVPVTLGAHCDARGSHEYNDPLSFRRAKASVEYLISKGVSSSRVTSKGYGKRKLFIAGENLTEEQHRQNRRVTIQYNIFGGDAESIIYNTIAPDESLKKTLPIVVEDHEVDKCLRRETGNKHVIKTYEETEVHAKMTLFKEAPLDFLLPHLVSPNEFSYYINSCRYYSNSEKPTVIVRAFPDIQWKLNFFLNLTNPLSVKWQNFSAEKHRELQSKAGKIGAEKRWKQKDATLGFGINANWNKQSKDSYKDRASYDKEFEGRFKLLYDIFGGMGDMAKAITTTTKGAVRNKGFKNTPISYEVMPPNLTFDACWYLKRDTKKGQSTNDLGTQIELDFKADPLIGLKITIDLIGAAVGFAAGAISGGSAAPGAVRIYNTIQDRMKSGLDVGDKDLGIKASADIFVDLVITSKISTELDFSFNTAGDSNIQTKFENNMKLKVELKAGVILKGEVALIVVKVNGYFKATASGEASITFGHTLSYEEDNRLYYEPKLGFDGLNAEYVVVASAGIASTKKIPEAEAIDDETKVTIAEGNFPEIIPAFDVVDNIRKLTGVDPKIPIL